LLLSPLGFHGIEVSKKIMLFQKFSAGGALSTEWAVQFFLWCINVWLCCCKENLTISPSTVLDTSIPWEPSRGRSKCTGWSTKDERWGRGPSKQLYICGDQRRRNKECWRLGHWYKFLDCMLLSRICLSGSGTSMPSDYQDQLWETKFAHDQTVLTGPLPWTWDILDYTIRPLYMAECDAYTINYLFCIS
jgi:hypothetical protein